MNWLAEAQALIDDMKPFVEDIKVSTKRQSDNNRLFFDIVLLEKKELLVRMDSSGFTICDSKEESQGNEVNVDQKAYETINALLDDNSEKYRIAFSAALNRKIESLQDL